VEGSQGGTEEAPLVTRKGGLQMVFLGWKMKQLNEKKRKGKTGESWGMNPVSVPCECGDQCLLDFSFLTG
jgi:hypothetical protein